METKTTKQKVVEVLFLSNGNTAVFENHEQVPELQKSWYKMFVKFLEENDVDVIGSTFSFPDFNGWREAKLIKTENGYNLDFKS